MTENGKSDSEVEVQSLPDPVIISGTPGFEFRGAFQQGAVMMIEYIDKEAKLLKTLTLVGEHFIDVHTASLDG